MMRFMWTIGFVVVLAGCSHKRCERVSFDDCDDDDDDIVSVSAPYSGTRFTHDYREVGTTLPYERSAPYASETQPGYRLTTSQPATADSVFVRQAALTNHFEIEMGRLGQQNASHPEVRNFAKHLGEDHRQSQSELESAAMRMNLQVPSDLDARHLSMTQQLAALSGTEFDRQFIDMAIRGHREAIANFEARAGAGPSNEIRTYATDTLPSLRRHLQMALDLQARIGG